MNTEHRPETMPPLPPGRRAASTAGRIVAWLRAWRWPFGRRRLPAADTLPADPPAAPAAPPAPVVLERCVSVVIPALNEARRIAEVVRYALSDPATAEVIVIDDSSIDDTAALARAAGAQVMLSTMLGKGASMRDGLARARHEWIVYLDGDLSGLQPGIVGALARPLAEDRADFVKAAFGRSAGRVTELTAKPMLKVFFPELAHLRQPLGGLIAVRASLLRQLDFEDGYGVDIALVIDAAARGARVAEVDIGSLEHESQSLGDLAAMANEISRVIYTRSRNAGRLHVEQIARMYEAQRQATASIEYIALRRRGRSRLLLLDLDGAVAARPLLAELARHTGHARELQALHEHHAATERAALLQAEAALFRFVHRRQLEQAAMALPLKPGVVEWVNAMRRGGFMVGVLSHGWFAAAEVVRRRVFADFALAHTLQFVNEISTGELRLNPALLPDDEAPAQGQPDLVWALRRLRAAAAADGGEPRADTPAGSKTSVPGFEVAWCAGQGPDSLALLREADRAFVLLPADAALRRIPGATFLKSYAELTTAAVAPASAD
jgi:glucosyl-3-phosphoglycerate synthase